MRRAKVTKLDIVPVGSWPYRRRVQWDVEMNFGRGGPVITANGTCDTLPQAHREIRRWYKRNKRTLRVLGDQAS